MSKARQFIKENDIKLGEREGFNYMLTDDDRLFDEVERLLVEFAEQESIDFAYEVATDPMGDSVPKEILKEFYDTWKSKQEESHE